MRNILYHVYGLESMPHSAEVPLESRTGGGIYPVVKTHELPSTLAPYDPHKVIYLIRDGRDALVSTARHRSDIVAPGSDYRENLTAAILARGASHFGGWSKNVKEWCNRADIVIRFENLISNPLNELTKLQSVVSLPAPNVQDIPNFIEMRNGQQKYGSFVDDPGKSQLFFRRGIVGAWKDEMPSDLHELFWEYHGHMMAQAGYA